MKNEVIENFNPSTCISGKIMRINRLVANVFRKHLKALNITDSQLSLMFVLSKRKRIKQSELSRLAIIEKSTLNRNLKRLIERGFLSRENFPLIEITENGIEFVITAIPPWNLAMEEIRTTLEEEGEAAINLISQKLKTNKCI